MLEVIELIVDPPSALDGPERAAVTDAIEAAQDFALAASVARERGASALTVAIEPASSLHDEAAADAGFEVVREILQLRRSLPMDDPGELPTRAFVPGVDEEAWLEVNNRAFAWHPDQGGWDVEQLRDRQAEPWFDPDGFLLHERTDDSGAARLAGFCWTKVHEELDPPVGEIYVIGIDPDLQGHGLGRKLTLAGLDWLARQGIGKAMLYVEADNIPARALYEDLGFEVHQSHRRYAVSF